MASSATPQAGYNPFQTVKNCARTGLDHRAGHFRPLRIIAQALEPIVLSTVRCFCVVQKQKGVAGAMIEAQEPLRESTCSKSDLSTSSCTFRWFSDIVYTACSPPHIGSVLPFGRDGHN